MLGRLRYLAVALTVIGCAFVVSAVDASPADAHHCSGRCDDGRTGTGTAGPTGVGARVRGDGSIGTRATGASSNCVYSRVDVSGLNQVSPENPGPSNGYTQLRDGTVVTWIQWRCADAGVSRSPDCVRVSSSVRGDELFAIEGQSIDCDGDGIVDIVLGDAIVEIGDPNELAALALDAVPWPELEIVTFPDTEVSIISGFEIPLLLVDAAGTTFETDFEADAEDNGLVVTATATPQVVNWDTSQINTQFGYSGPGETEVECETFGEAFMPSEIVANPCVARWRGSSSGQVDNAGNQHRISLVSIVTYDIEYETNLPGVAVTFGVDEFELEFERNGVPVSEIQVLHSSGG